MADLNGIRVACIATDGFEESELTETVNALRNEGARVDIISNKTDKIQAFHHHDKTIQVDVDYCIMDGINADDYDALLLPGGALNADALRMVPEVQQFVKEMCDVQKPIAAICHAPWILISAGVIAGKTLTSYETIQDDMKNAGVNWVNQQVAEDGNIVTSRKPSDIPAFNRVMIRMFAESMRPSRAFTEAA